MTRLTDCGKEALIYLFLLTTAIVIVSPVRAVHALDCRPLAPKEDADESLWFKLWMDFGPLFNHVINGIGIDIGKSKSDIVVQYENPDVVRVCDSAKYYSCEILNDDRLSEAIRRERSAGVERHCGELIAQHRQAETTEAPDPSVAIKSTKETPQAVQYSHSALCAPLPGILILPKTIATLSLNGISHSGKNFCKVNISGGTVVPIREKDMVEGTSECFAIDGERYRVSVHNVKVPERKPVKCAITAFLVPSTENCYGEPSPNLKQAEEDASAASQCVE